MYCTNLYCTNQTHSKYNGPVGYAIRVNKQDVGRARAILDPDFAAAVGDELMAVDPNTTEHDHVLKGVPSTLDLTQVQKMFKQGLGYTIRPIRFLPCQQRGQNNVEFIAVGPPPRESFQIAGMNTHATIVPYRTSQNHNKWEKALNRHGENEAEPTDDFAEDGNHGRHDWHDLH